MATATVQNPAPHEEDSGWGDIISGYQLRAELQTPFVHDDPKTPRWVVKSRDDGTITSIWLALEAARTQENPQIERTLDEIRGRTGAGNSIKDTKYIRGMWGNPEGKPTFHIRIVDNKEGLSGDDLGHLVDAANRIYDILNPKSLPGVKPLSTKPK